MKGYIYTMFAGADPDKGWRMTDPILTPVPTLGACVPNIRRLVVTGDHIFVVSGRTRKVQQYVVGGFQVAEKIDALTAYHRFPENRMRPGPDGQSLVLQSPFPESAGPPGSAVARTALPGRSI